MDEPRRCPARSLVSPDEIAVLSDLPAAAHQITGELHCELQAGHTGLHQAQGQAYAPDRQRWLQWQRDWTDVSVSECCTAKGPADELGENETCLLLSRHPGAHTFEIREDR